ncbi:MAG: transposase [Prevotella sp.]
MDLWQYKTLLEARIPRYRIGKEVKGVEVPWALPTSRLSWLMEKTETLLSTRMSGDWMADALSYNIDEINAVVFMFKRHLKGIVRALVTRANNGKAERTNGSIQEIETIGRGYGTAERYRIAILFFYGGLDITVNSH